jgi:thiol-disulfide isomerase/thioredoxin
MLLTVSVYAHAAGEGDAVPAWQLQLVAGTGLAYPQAAAGSPSVVLFWATWCPYCKAFMPYLDAIRQDYAEHDLRVFAINVKEDGDPVAFAKGHDYQFTCLLAGDDVAEQYAVRFVPGLFVVDAAGMIVFRRKSTDLPPGRKVAEFWDEQVRIALDESIGGSN